jgi:hypothetical protein
MPGSSWWIQGNRRAIHAINSLDSNNWCAIWKDDLPAFRHNRLDEEWIGADTTTTTLMLMFTVGINAIAKLTCTPSVPKIYVLAFFSEEHLSRWFLVYRFTHFPIQACIVQCADLHLELQLLEILDGLVKHGRLVSLQQAKQVTRHSVKFHH